MLHTTKFPGNRPAGSGDFLRVFTIYGRGCHLGHMTSIMSSDFSLANVEYFLLAHTARLYMGNFKKNEAEV